MALVIDRRYNKLVLVLRILYSVDNLCLLQVTKTIWVLVCVPEYIFHKCEVSAAFNAIN
jgi:hypothetical protein